MQLVPKTKYVFSNFGGELPGSSPLVAGLAFCITRWHGDTIREYLSHHLIFIAPLFPTSLQVISSKLVFGIKLFCAKRYCIQCKRSKLFMKEFSFPSSDSRSLFLLCSYDIFVIHFHTRFSSVEGRGAATERSKKLTVFSILC